MEQLEILENSFEITEGNILFKNYEIYKNEAIKVAKELEAEVVTEETLKVIKKRVADSRKITTALTSKLKDYRKQLLIPYELVKIQVDEIVGIINNAEQDLREETKIIEEKQKQDKRKEIEEIYILRLEKYENIKEQELTLDNFFDVKYLNKSESLKKIELDIVNKMESTESSLQLLKSYPENERELILEHFLKDLNLANALNKFNEIKATSERLRVVEVAPVKDIELTETKRSSFTLEVYTEEDYNKLITYCIVNNIRYK